VLEILIGFAAGYLSGFFGIGGGLITTPAIRLLLGSPAFIAVGTPLLTNIPAALVGAVSYAKRGFLARDCILPLAGFGVIGVIIGSAVTPWIGGNIILLITAGVISIIGLQFILEDSTAPVSTSGVPTFAKLALVGGVIGFASGVLGLGGGFLLVPLLHFWLRLDMKTAFGTSLAVVGAITIPGAIVHYFLGHVDLRLGILLIIGVIPGALIGSRVAIRLSNKTLKTAFGFFLIGVALYLGYFEIAKLVS
jgi:uncharacterized membrane protein YfcA